jgi:hypothetical protein
MKNGLCKAIDQLALDPNGATDAPLLKRFIAERDETACLQHLCAGTDLTPCMCRSARVMLTGHASRCSTS